MTTNTLEAPRIETREAFEVVGISMRDTPEGDFGALWEDFCDRWESFEPLAATDESFGVSDDFDHETGEFTYLAGVAFDGDGSIPEDANRMALTGGTYAVFETDLETIGETMSGIYEEWLPDSDYERGEGPEFERYEDGFDHERDSSFEVWVPVEE